MAKKSTKTEKASPSPDDKVLFNVELTRSLREDASAKAKTDGTTLTAVVRAAIQAYVDGDLVFQSKIIAKKQQ